MTGTTEQNSAKRIGREIAAIGEKRDAPLVNRRTVLYFAASLAAIAAALLGGWSLAIDVSARDIFSDAANMYDALLCAARLFLPILCEFLAVYMFAFSPLCMTACLAALSARGTRVGMTARALLAAQSASPHKIAALILFAGCAIALAAFCALAASLSPKLRSIGFSTLDGRREALTHTLGFFILSGAAAILTLAPALIIHFS